MKLTELNPRWVGAGGPGISDKDGKPVPAQEGVGLGYDCPCGCGARRYVDFINPVDGSLPVQKDMRHQWAREGDTFETLTLKPSILHTKPHGCGWHGYITNGLVTVA